MKTKVCNTKLSFSLLSLFLREGVKGFSLQLRMRMRRLEHETCKDLSLCSNDAWVYMAVTV